jgi:hypothetical protein
MADNAHINMSDGNKTGLISACFLLRAVQNSIQPPQKIV